MEAARTALGYDRIDLLSESAGTRTAIIYSWRYPDSIHRSVMIGVNPPGHFLWDPGTTDEQIDRYAALCAKDDSCRARTDDLAASLHATDAEIPDRWLFLPIKKGNVRITSFFGLMESSPAAAPVAGPTIVDMWLSAAEGDASGLWAGSFIADVLFPKLFVWGQYASFGRADAQAARDYFSNGGQDDGSNIGRAASTTYGWGNGRLVDAWPAAPDENEYSQVRTSNVETLVIGGELDFSTPPQVATKELLPYLPNGHEVVLPGIGHTGSFFAVQPEASSRLINTFFDTGKVDDSLYQPETVDFTPANSFGKIAKVFLGLALALATVTVLSLLVDGLVGTQARPLRHQGERGAPVGIPDHPRPGRLAPRHPDRPRDDARHPDRRRARGRPVHRPAGRPRDLPGLGAPQLDKPEEGPWGRGRSRRRAGRGLAWVPCDGRFHSAGHRDPRGRRRRQPRADLARHAAGQFRR